MKLFEWPQATYLFGAVIVWIGIIISRANTAITFSYDEDTAA
jgi:hypothetical protein